MSDLKVPSFIDEPVTILPGISIARSRLLKKLGIETVRDLLWLIPRTYADWSSPVPISQLKEGEICVVQAAPTTVPSLRRRGKLSWIRSRLADRSGAINTIWFNQPWLQDKLARGKSFLFRGKIEAKGNHRQFMNPEIRDDDDPVPFEPIYPLTEGLTVSVIRKAVAAALEDPRLRIDESLPASVRISSRLATAEFALRRIHFPESQHDIAIAHRRLAFEELFLVVAVLRALKAGRANIKGPHMTLNETCKERLKETIEKLPFELTPSQINALRDILNDYSKKIPSNRLIEGDVGSGKTVVAAIAMAAVCWCGYQAVLMAPTSILAHQHADTIASLLEGSGLTVALLTGSVPPARRRRLQEELARGCIDILIGTHAVLNENVVFKRLGLCVTDEQHRFGVSQRLRLTDTDSSPFEPHVLVMSATPIPRTLAMVLYGDLDISIMKDMPKGRQAVKTYTARENDRPRVERLIRREVDASHQVYVVCPSIDVSEEINLRSAEETYRRLSRDVFPDYAVGLMHGRLKPAEKKAVMKAFSEGKIDILVSTTVIEVGIDQPRATLLIVENAERFGLSQLHQLRGRVGRSSLPSFCVLVSDSDDPLVRRRLRALCRSHDGFEIAEEDLLLRGPGDFFGVEQHGLPDFKVANLYEDAVLLREASAACDELFLEDPLLSSSKNACVIRAFRERYGDRLARPGI
ncbi:MAG: ATP-dependent DNA helicase RecG [Clostridiaceae bacterium]|nr:ATP-dependent DNA helicase RecG [Clostridiaceae bacterium]